MPSTRFNRFSCKIWSIEFSPPDVSILPLYFYLYVNSSWYDFGQILCTTLLNCMLYSYFADRRLYLIKKYRNTKRVFYISTLQIHSSFFTCCQGLSCLRRCTSVLHQSTAKTDSQHQTHKTQIQIQIQLYRNTKKSFIRASQNWLFQHQAHKTQIKIQIDINAEIQRYRNTEIQQKLSIRALQKLSHNTLQQNV